MVIWSKNDSIENERVYFRKKFYLSNLNETTLKIAVENKYYLWVNGVLAVVEGGLNRGATPKDGYYDEVDLSSYLKIGKNTIAILVWYWGNGGRNNKPTFRAGLWTDGIAAADTSFKMLPASAYTKGNPPYPAYLYGGHNIAYNANLDTCGWQNSDFDDSAWENAVEVDATAWGKLLKRPIPLLKNYGAKNYVKTEEVIDGDKKIITAHLPYGAWISPILNVDAKKDDFIDIRTDRYVVHGGPGDVNEYNGQRCEYVAKDGVQSFEFYGSFYGENVIYTMPKDTKIISLSYRETGYDCEFDGSFNCDDEDLNTLYEKCKRTLYICMRDNFMDCPDRERGQWIGDASSQAPQVFYVLSRKSDALLKKCISDFINWKNGDVLWGNVPGIHCSELPSQSLNAISSMGMLKEYVINTGDKSVLDFCIDAIEKYLLLWDMNDKGLVNQRQGNWAWYDHGIDIDEDVLENCWYALALEFSLSIRYNETLQNRYKSIHENFNKEFWKENCYKSGSFVDERANAMAYLAGFIQKEQQEKIIEVLNKIYNATPYMEYYVLEAMFAMGYKKEAMHRMKERFMPLIQNENSTIWEDFEFLGTHNHAWSGCGLTHLCKWIAGIRPVKAGYEEFIVEPYLGELKNINVTVPSIKGKISVEINEKYICIKKPSNVDGKLIWQGKEYIFEKSATEFELNL